MEAIATRGSWHLAAAVFDFESVAEFIARTIEACGIAIIVLGAIFATYVFLSAVSGTREFSAGYHRYRNDLGRGILLGLEFLVAADIIGTVAVEPTYENVGVLGLIVLIRTFLSFSLEVEINGRWPWQADKRRDQYG